MRHAYIEPSAWVKRDDHEAGTDLTHDPFERLLKPWPSRVRCSRVGITEVVSILNRHRNAGRVTPPSFTLAYAYVEADSRMVRPLAVRNTWIDASIGLLFAPNPNATDALHPSSA